MKIGTIASPWSYDGAANSLMVYAEARGGAQGAYANEARGPRCSRALQRGTKGAARTASMPKAAIFQNSERMSGIPET
jgi:hypothetical protein